MSATMKSRRKRDHERERLQRKTLRGELTTLYSSIEGRLNSMFAMDGRMTQKEVLANVDRLLDVIQSDPVKAAQTVSWMRDSEKNDFPRKETRMIDGLQTDGISAMEEAGPVEEKPEPMPAQQPMPVQPMQLQQQMPVKTMFKESPHGFPMEDFHMEEAHISDISLGFGVNLPDVFSTNDLLVQGDDSEVPEYGASEYGGCGAQLQHYAWPSLLDNEDEGILAML